MEGGGGLMPRCRGWASERAGGGLETLVRVRGGGRFGVRGAKTEPCGLGFGWICREGWGEGPGGLCGAGGWPSEQAGGLGAGPVRVRGGGGSLACTKLKARATWARF